MTRERFIKKWLGNNDFKYCEEHKELMREDLDRVIEFAQQQVNSVDLSAVSKSVCDHSWMNAGLSVQGKSLIVCTKCRETKQTVC